MFKILQQQGRRDQRFGPFRTLRSFFFLFCSFETFSGEIDLFRPSFEMDAAERFMAGGEGQGGDLSGWAGEI
jgi:hypothetical protein